MTNLELYNQAFMDVFSVEEKDLANDFSCESVSNWDSMHKLNLMNILEDTFDFIFEPGDMLNFNSYGDGKSILAKYNIHI